MTYSLEQAYQLINSGLLEVVGFPRIDDQLINSKNVSAGSQGHGGIIVEISRIDIIDRIRTLIIRSADD
jgi:hypothetical protein